MTIQDLGSIGELVAAVATIATLIYLAAQLRQNTKAIRHQTSYSLIRANTDASYRMTDDPGLAALFLRGIEDRGSLTPEEQLRFNGYLFAYMNQVDYVYEQYLAGALDERTWRKMERELPMYLRLPGINAWWQQDKIRFSEEFTDYIDNKIAGLGPTLDAPTLPTADTRGRADAT